MDTLNNLAFIAGSYILFHPIRSLTAYLSLLAVAVAGIIWTSQPNREEP
jgi:hypothetical protein